MQNANAVNNNTSMRGGKLPPALNPEQPALTQPWRDFVSRGFITSIEVKFTGNSTNVAFGVGPLVRVPEGLPREGLPAGMAKHYIIESNLWSPKGIKQKTGSQKESVQLPKKSLVTRDLKAAETSDEDLRIRASAVAEALTDTVARGRIGSLKFMRKGVDTFEKWWRGAPAEMKTRLLMDQKHHAAASQSDHIRFAEVVTTCPFRGPVPTPSEEEEEVEEKPRNGKAIANGAPSSPPKPAKK